MYKHCLSGRYIWNLDLVHITVECLLIMLDGEWQTCLSTAVEDAFGKQLCDLASGSMGLKYSVGVFLPPNAHLCTGGLAYLGKGFTVTNSRHGHTLTQCVWAVLTDVGSGCAQTVCPGAWDLGKFPKFASVPFWLGQCVADSWWCSKAAARCIGGPLGLWGLNLCPSMCSWLLRLELSPECLLKVEPWKGWRPYHPMILLGWLSYLSVLSCQALCWKFPSSLYEAS